MAQRNIFNYIFIKLFLIFILGYVTNCCMPGGIVKKVKEINHDNESLFTWLVLISHKKDAFFASAFGTLIHPKAVLTAGTAFTEFGKNELVTNYYVEKDCKLNDHETLLRINCTRRKVAKIIHHDGQLTPENDWVLVILEKPFDITPTTAPITLANDINAVDTRLCFLTRWMRAEKIVEPFEAKLAELIIKPYTVQFIDEQFNPGDLQLYQLKQGPDWIIGEKFHVGVTKKQYSVIPLNFLGSPMTCFLKKHEHLVQVGIATFRFEVPLNIDNQHPIIHEGSLIKLIDSYDEIMKKLNENV